MGHKITERLDWILRFETQPYRGEQSGRQIWKGNHIVGTHSLKSATYEDHQNNATYKLDGISLQFQSDLDFWKIHSTSQDDLIYKALSSTSKVAITCTMVCAISFVACCVEDPGSFCIVLAVPSCRSRSWHQKSKSLILKVWRACPRLKTYSACSLIYTLVAPGDVLKLPQDVSKVTGTLGAVVGSSLCWICSPLRKISSCLGQYSIVSPCIHTHWSGGCHVWIFRSEVFWVVKYEPQKMVYSGYVCEIWMIFKVTPRRFLGPYTSTVSLAKLSPVGEVPPACISSCPEKEQLGVGPGEKYRLIPLYSIEEVSACSNHISVSFSPSFLCIGSIGENSLSHALEWQATPSFQRASLCISASMARMALSMGGFSRTWWQAQKSCREPTIVGWTKSLLKTMTKVRHVPKPAPGILDMHWEFWGLHIFSGDFDAIGILCELQTWHLG